MTEPALPATRGRAALDEELSRYGRRNVTLRLVDALLKGVPGGPDLAPWVDFDGCVSSETSDPSIATRAVALANDPSVDRVLFAAKSIDTGDTGITILTGVRTALSMFMSEKGFKAGADAQQRADAGLKALGIAYLATQLLPRDPARRVTVLRSLPAGRALLLYYAAIEIALPFGASSGSGHFVADLVDQQSKRMASKLLGVIGRQGVTDAQETLEALTGELDRAVVDVVPHTGSLVETLEGILPSLIRARTAEMSDVVAAGADALPVYRFLAARLTAETRVALARWEVDPTSEPQPDPPAEEGPAPPVVPLGLAAQAIDPQHLAPDAMAAPASAAPDPEHSGEVASAPPGEHDLNGVFHKAMPWGSLWLVFTRDGVFSNHPPAAAQPDWLAHADAGHQVGTYQHRGDQLQIRWPNGTATTSTFSRESTALVIDGGRCVRCDWNLDGHGFQGAWRARSGGAWWSFARDGRFNSDRGTGRYTLGVGEIVANFDGGRVEKASLYSTLSPDSESPDTLWVAGEPFDRADAERA